MIATKKMNFFLLYAKDFLLKFDKGIM